MLTLFLIRHFILPHTSNNQKAKLLHSSSMSLFILLIIVSQLALSFLPSLGAPKVLGFAANISVDEVVRLTNEKRAQNGLPALMFNETLAKAALAKGNDMLMDDYWAHVSPDGTEPWDFFISAGYRYRFAGENLARDFTNATSAVDAWMASPSHRENMLSGNYKEIGIAVVEGDMDGVDTTLVVQFFGTKFSDTLPVAPVAQAQTPTTAPEPTTQSLAVTPTTPEVLVSPFNVTKAFSATLVTVLLFVLLVDIFAVSRRKIVRVSSRSFAHLAFLGMILAILIVAKAGEIL